MKKRALLINKEYNEEIVPVLLNRWSDDFDPNNSKKNRGSIWVFTITIIPHYENGGKLRYTYPISISNKAPNHDPVESLFFSELKELSSGKNNRFYSMNSQSYVRVHAEIFVNLMDQPERRSSNYIMLGNSTYSSQWGKSADIGNSVTYLPSLFTYVYTYISSI